MLKRLLDSGLRAFEKNWYQRIAKIGIGREARLISKLHKKENVL